jgi:hypothetical protein
MTTEKSYDWKIEGDYFDVMGAYHIPARIMSVKVK